VLVRRVLRVYGGFGSGMYVRTASRCRLCSAVSQFPSRTPIRLAPFTRAMPAASSA
jgi:hypothetical protein